jgi:hypothetical protein
MGDMKSTEGTVTCPQCSGRGWKWPGFLERPSLILKFIQFVASTLCKETLGFSGCRACDGKKAVPADWIED